MVGVGLQIRMAWLSSVESCLHLRCDFKVVDYNTAIRLVTIHINFQYSSSLGVIFESRAVSIFVRRDSPWVVVVWAPTPKWLGIKSCYPTSTIKRRSNRIINYLDMLNFYLPYKYIVSTSSVKLRSILIPNSFPHRASLRYEAAL